MPVETYIQLPRDQYGHAGAPAEWWWHIGTLNAGGRLFGFEINAAGFVPADGSEPFLLAYIMLTDVLNAKHYQLISPSAYDPDWAQSDPTQPWRVAVGKPCAPGSISMSEEAGDPLAMRIKAGFISADGMHINFTLSLVSQREPLLVFGSGRSPLVDPSGKGPLQQYNYYYSLTDLRAQGTVMLGEQQFDVTGLTWMDHEYGAWPAHINWILQDVQLDNGIRLSNFTQNGENIAIGVSADAHVTVLYPDGTSAFYSSLATPLTAWQAPGGPEYFPAVRVDIPELDASLTVTSLIPGQEFNNQVRVLRVYEGVASAVGTFQGEKVSGTAWNEQHLTGAATA